MSETGLTTIQLKKINKSKVYHYIYQQHTTSKLQIVQELQMGLSTVSQNLTLLEQEGYIQRNGYFDSTGGRKAQTIQIVPDFRISIGIGILKEMFHMTSIDLYGHVLDMETISLSYEDTDAYYKQIAEKIQAFITSHHYDPQKILGISIATQGITSSDHTTVTYGKILHNTGMNVDHFSSRLPFACHLEHDSKSAAHLELWNHPELDSAIVILLNRNLGGAIITDRHIHQGSSMHSGALEHMCVNPDGPLCYCGNRGCLETYCSADALEQASGMPIPDFFHSLREISGHTTDTETDAKKSSQISQIWEDYLNHLAFAMKNLNLIIDAPMILSGYLASFLTGEDTQYLLKQINAATPFPLRKEQVLVGTYGQYTQAAGAALYYVETFLNTL